MCGQIHANLLVEHVLISNLLLLLLLAGGTGGGDCSCGSSGCTLGNVGEGAGATINGLHEAGGLGRSALTVLGKSGHHLGDGNSVERLL